MPSSPGRSPGDASGPIALYTDSPSPCRTKLPLRPLPHKRKRPLSPSSTLALPALKKTRYHPDLSLCHACKRRTTPSKPLRLLPSQWRVALLCGSCFLAIRAGESCSYCFARFGGAVPTAVAGLVQCRRCRCRVHLACVPRMRGYASLPHDLDPHLFTCIDCAAIPEFFRAGASAANRTSLDRAERASRSAAAEKAEEASRARSKTRHKAKAATCAVVLARYALDSALSRSGTLAEQLEEVRVSSSGGSSRRLLDLRHALSDLRLLGRELFVPGNGYLTPSMEIDRPSGSGDAEGVRGVDVIEQVGYGVDLPRPQKLPLCTYARRRGNIGRSRGKVLFLITYSLKRKKALAMEKGWTPAAGEQGILAVHDQFLLAEGEYEHKKSSAPDAHSKRPLEEEELEENLGDKKRYGGYTNLASHMTHGVLKTYLRRYKLISSHDERKPAGIQSEGKPEQHSALLEAPVMPDRYLKKYSRKFRLNGVDEGAKATETKTSGMPDRYVLKYSRKNGLKSNAEKEQVVPDNGLGTRWCLSRCTAAGNADAPQEPGTLALYAANDNPPSGSSSE